MQLVGNSKQLWGFLEHTLQWVQLGEERLLERSKRALDQLAMLGYITMVEEGDTAFYTITRLGTATYKGKGSDCVCVGVCAVVCLCVWMCVFMCVCGLCIH